MPRTEKPETTRPGARLLSPALALATVLGAPAAPALAVPPAGPGPAPSLASFVDPATLRRGMARQRIVVAADGRTEERIVAPAQLCASLSPGASRSVTLPDVRWGLRTTTSVALSRRTNLEIRWPGQPPRQETLADGMPGNAERAFTFPRPGPKTIQVTAFAPPASGAPAPRRTSGIADGSSNTIQLGESTPTPRRTSGIADGTSNTIQLGESTPTPRRTSGIKDGTSNTIQLGETTTGASGDGSVLTGTSGRGRTVCLSNLFVQDPAIEVRVNVTGPGGPDSDSRKTF